MGSLRGVTTGLAALGLPDMLPFVHIEALTLLFIRGRNSAARDGEAIFTLSFDERSFLSRGVWELLKKNSNSVKFLQEQASDIFKVSKVAF